MTKAPKGYKEAGVSQREVKECVTVLFAALETAGINYVTAAVACQLMIQTFAAKGIRIMVGFDGGKESL